MAGLGVVGAVVTAHDTAESGVDGVGEGPVEVSKWVRSTVRFQVLTTCKAHEESCHQRWTTRVVLQ